VNPYPNALAVPGVAHVLTAINVSAVGITGHAAASVANTYISINNELSYQVPQALVFTADSSFELATLAWTGEYLAPVGASLGWLFYNTVPAYVYLYHEIQGYDL
jgi:UDP-N-acetylmuramyl pentapeptide phosphotransferase/UDP-N-acetylglucosamine-1-phosphate transferase